MSPLFPSSHFPHGSGFSCSLGPTVFTQKLFLVTAYLSLHININLERKIRHRKALWTEAFVPMPASRKREVKLCWVSANSWPIVRHIHNHCDSLLEPAPNIMFTSGVRIVRHGWASYVHIRAINFIEISWIHSVGSVMVSTRLPSPHAPVLHALPFIPDTYASSTILPFTTSISQFQQSPFLSQTG